MRYTIEKGKVGAMPKMAATQGGNEIILGQEAVRLSKIRDHGDEFRRRSHIFS